MNSPTPWHAPRAVPEHPPGDTLLGAGILVGPSVALGNQLVNYLLVYWACQTGNLYFLHLVSLVSLGVVASVGLAVARHWRRPELAGDTEGSRVRDERRRFMAAVGALASLLSALTILAFMAATFFVDPCQR